jgi:hypothetical protein
MLWEDFDREIYDKHIYSFENNSNLNIVLFGSCHMASIGFYLNKLLDYKYNVHIIISWYYKEKRFNEDTLKKINSRIHDLLSKCDYFLYHIHINDYDVYASTITSFLLEKCIKYIVPNYHLDYTTSNYDKSLTILKYHINISSFSEFEFIIQYHKEICFFNTPLHPTHYLLFLQSQSIVNKILNRSHIITINDYYSLDNRIFFKEFPTVRLPGREIITDEITNMTGILGNADYYDI